MCVSKDLGRIWAIDTQFTPQRSFFPHKIKIDNINESAAKGWATI